MTSALVSAHWHYTSDLLVRNSVQQWANCSGLPRKARTITAAMMAAARFFAVDSE